MSVAACARLVLSLAATCALAGCSAMLERPDGMCRAIADFANASTPNSDHEVTLQTDWGGSILGKDGEIAVKHCQHDGYAPGKKLCDYLLENASTEFGTNNFLRAFACVSKTNRIHTENLRVEKLDAELWSSSARYVNQNVDVGIMYDEGCYQCKTAPSLKIAAKRYED